VHLDDVGTEVGQQHSSDGTGPAACQFQHAHARERILFVRYRQ
jgi:hypothetical protein